MSFHMKMVSGVRGNPVPGCISITNRTETADIYLPGAGTIAHAGQVEQPSNAPLDTGHSTGFSTGVKPTVPG